MHIAPFATELFFSRYEFSTPYQLCNSDCESLTVDELLSLAGEDIASLGHQRLGYVQSEGPPELRAAIAATYASVREEEVLVLGSPVEGIYLAARALLNPGDEVIVLCPAYDALINLFEHVVGADHVRRWTFAPGTKGWDLRLEDLERLFTARTKLVVVNFPHNPTSRPTTRRGCSTTKCITGSCTRAHPRYPRPPISATAASCCRGCRRHTAYRGSAAAGWW
jgi:hypothetical protein